MLRVSQTRVPKLLGPGIGLLAPRTPRNASHACVPSLSTAASAVAKATKAAKAVKKGTKVQVKKIRTNPHFTRNHTLRQARNPKYAVSSLPKQPKLNEFTIVKAPVFTDSTMKEIERHNTLVFIVDTRANKCQIAQALKSLYNVDVARVNTLIRYVSTPAHPARARIAVGARPRARACPLCAALDWDLTASGHSCPLPSPRLARPAFYATPPARMYPHLAPFPLPSPTLPSLAQPRRQEEGLLPPVRGRRGHGRCQPHRPRINAARVLCEVIVSKNTPLLSQPCLSGLSLRALPRYALPQRSPKLYTRENEQRTMCLRFPPPPLPSFRLNDASWQINLRFPPLSALFSALMMDSRD